MSLKTVEQSAQSFHVRESETGFVIDYFYVEL